MDNKHNKIQKLLKYVFILIIIISFLMCLTGCDQTGLRKYDKFDVYWKFEEIENTGVGHEFYYSIKINGHYISNENPTIPAAKKLECEITIIEDDKYDDISIKKITIDNVYKKNKTTTLMTVTEKGGYSNRGTYANFRVTLEFSGHKDISYEDYEDYQNYDPYDGMK